MVTNITKQSSSIDYLYEQCRCLLIYGINLVTEQLYHLNDDLTEVNDQHVIEPNDELLLLNYKIVCLVYSATQLSQHTCCNRLQSFSTQLLGTGSSGMNT